jgi:hypothetical protein
LAKLPREVSIDEQLTNKQDLQVEVTDPAALRIRKSLRQSVTDDEVRFRSGFILIKISRESIDRAANLLAALKAQIDQRSWVAADEGEPGVLVDGEKVELSLSEGHDHIPHIPTVQEMRNHQRYGWSIPEYDRAPSGRLQLAITNASYLGVRQKWADGKRQRIEDVLQRFLEGIEAAAEGRKNRRLEREEQERRWAEERRKREERERLETIERVRGAILKQQAKAYEESQRLRIYIEAVRKRVAGGSPNEAEVREWIAWAEDYVKRLDPFDRDLPTLVSEEDALRLKWQYRDA